MISINIDKVKAEKKARESHKPTIRIILPEVIEDAEKTVDQEIGKIVEEAQQGEQVANSLQEALINDLNNQERELRIERAKLSNKYKPMIADGADQSELAAHYKKIESISAEMREIYDKREHVRQHGRLPEQGSAQASINHSDILALKDNKRSLENRRSKLRAKIAKGKATNAPKLAEWELYLDQLDAEYKVTIDRINELRNE